ncbi:MAG TPA: SEC-C metal-binding domain-containing protein [Opitutus sp.]|nr:SEC-C metal-binding domain-containing protein [Opitutus sp.]
MSNFHTSHRIIPAGDINYTAEAELVQERAARAEPCVIRLGPIVLFSTATRDAWMIDVQHGEAACLARAGEVQPVSIEETASKFGVAWQGRHRLDDEAFVVIENDGNTQTYRDYPVAEIRSLVAGYPAEFSGVRATDPRAAHERMRTTSRNEPCPCGSGRKYKKCCLLLDESAVISAGRDVQRTESRARSSRQAIDDVEADKTHTTDFADEDRAGDFVDETGSTAATETILETVEPELAPEVRAAVDRIWDEFDGLDRPTSAQLDAWLDRLLALPPEATNWGELWDALARKEHPDLPAVFRRIAAVVPPTKAAGASYFYWGAMEKFVSRGWDDLVPEIASGFRRLGRESYDADALKHMVFWILAAGYDNDALAMEEHFLPIMRGDDNLMPYAVPSACRAIFELRVGLRLPELRSIAVSSEVESLTRELQHDVEDEIHVDFAQCAARVLCGEASSERFQREDFNLPRGGVREGSPEWGKALRQFETMMHVARDAWQSAGRPAGSAFRGLWLLVDAVYDERERRREKKSSSENLLDCLQPGGMERRIARGAADMLGTNTPHAHLLIEAHADLLRFATRHRLIGDADAAKSERNVAMLRAKLGFASRNKG